MTRLARQVIGVRAFVFMTLIGDVLSAAQPSADEGKQFAGLPQRGSFLGVCWEYPISCRPVGAG